MASTTFVDGTTPIVASWLNDVNKAVYQGTFPSLTTITVGSLSFSDTGVGFAYGISTNGYAQEIIQNTSTGTAASADYIVSNNLGTANTYYGDFGINSSTFTGTGSLSLPNATYLYSANGDLVLGTYTSNALRFVVNNGATDAGTVSSAGNWTLNATSSGSTLTVNGNGIGFGATYATLLSNAQYAGSWQYLANGAAWGIGNNFGGPANGLSFGMATVNSSGAGAALTWTIPLVISNAGNVTLNSPTSGTTLTVTGTGAGTAALAVNTSGTTGAQTATFSATNKPGSGTTAPTKWLPIIMDGTTYYIPAWT